MARILASPFSVAGTQSEVPEAVNLDETVVLLATWPHGRQRGCVAMVVDVARPVVRKHDVYRLLNLHQAVHLKVADVVHAADGAVVVG
eukprot:366406-Chlamydomonas_euryale.AAC.18